MLSFSKSVHNLIYFVTQAEEPHVCWSLTEQSWWSWYRTQEPRVFKRFSLKEATYWWPKVVEWTNAPLC